MATKPTEHTLQKAVKVLSGRAIAAPHRFRSFDRSKNESGVQHLSESDRGIRAGQPDTSLVVRCDYACVEIELKRPGCKHLKANQPTRAQLEEMERLREAGAYADVAWSCVEVVGHWRAAGVPLRNSADMAAEDADRAMWGRLGLTMDGDTLEQVAAKRKRTASKPRQAKPSRKALAFARVAHGMGP